MARIQVDRLGHALGATVRGLDLREPLHDETVAAIREAWLEHNLLRFPDQMLSPEQLVAFSGRFGEVDSNDRVPEDAHPDFPFVFLVANKPARVAPNGAKAHTSRQHWHSDLSFTDAPSTGTFLLAKTLPDVGGNTLFANMYMAYEALSPGMKALIEPLCAVHDKTNSKDFEKRPLEEQLNARRLNPPVVHPIVRIHPETGRRALYLGGARTRQFVGWTREESKPLLDFLDEHAIRYEFSYRHRWALNDLLMWDNRCTMHSTVLDYDPGQSRVLIRCALRGPVVGRPASALIPAASAV